MLSEAACLILHVFKTCSSFLKQKVFYHLHAMTSPKDVMAPQSFGKDIRAFRHCIFSVMLTLNCPPMPFHNNWVGLKAYIFFCHLQGELWSNDKRLSPTAVFMVLHLVAVVQSSCDKTLHVELRDVS